MGLISVSRLPCVYKHIHPYTPTRVLRLGHGGANEAKVGNDGAAVVGVGRCRAAAAGPLVEEEVVGLHCGGVAGRKVVGGVSVRPSVVGERSGLTRGLASPSPLMSQSLKHARKQRGGAYLPSSPGA